MSVESDASHIRIYLDQAATTWPKLSPAIEAAVDYMQHCGATSGRGAYTSARSADAWVIAARRNLSHLLSARDPGDVAFCSSGTHALNAALLGLIRPGDHVVATMIEHNSVLRPLELLKRERGVCVDIVPCDRGGLVDLDAARNCITDRTRAVIINHASNVTGRLQDLRPWSELAHAHGALLVVDASQTVGYVPVNMQELGIDVLASAGHKGLRAMAGSGFVIASPEVQAQLQPLMTGGTGTASERVDYVPTWPQTMEVGNLNIPAIISMAVASELIAMDDASYRCWHAPLQRLVNGLRQSPMAGQVRIVGHDSGYEHYAKHWLPIVSMQLEGWDIHDAAAVLDANFGIEVRAGFHCAARIHAAVGTQETGGTLRVSPGHSTTERDVDALVEALRAMLS